MGKSTISMAIFNSYFDITRRYLKYPHIMVTWNTPYHPVVSQESHFQDILMISPWFSPYLRPCWAQWQPLQNLQCPGRKGVPESEPTGSSGWKKMGWQSCSWELDWQWNTANFMFFLGGVQNFFRNFLWFRFISGFISLPNDLSEKKGWKSIWTNKLWRPGR